MKWLGKKIFPEKNKSIASHQAIVSAPLPEKLIVPLINHKGDLLTACVTVGQRVLKGEILTAINDLQKPPVHAATSGTVMAITEHPIVHAELKTAPCIVIGVDGLDKWGRQGEALIRPVSSFFHKEERGKNERNFFGDKYISQKVSAQQLREKCHQAGIVGFGGAGFPTALKLTNEKIKTLIINGVECEPFITADDRLMQERSQKICEGALLLQKIISAENIIIAIEDDKPQALLEMQQTAQQFPQIIIKTVASGYPSGSEKQLIYALTGKEVPQQHYPKDLGYVMVNVATAAAVYDALIENKPVIGRIVTLTGKGLPKPWNIEVLYGTPINWLLKQFGATEINNLRVVQGGNLMGIPVVDLQAPITKASNCLWIEPIQQKIKKEQPCVRCGFCVEVCPMNLMPQQLHWFIQGKNYDQVQQHHLFDCIECGACAYACPSEIPLVEYYHIAKQELRKIHIEQQHAAAAKVRFEKRIQRLAEPQERPIVAAEKNLKNTGPLTNGLSSSLETADKKAVIMAALVKSREKK